MPISDRLRILLVCIGLSLASAVALGLGRFAYALVLPVMQTGLGWSFTEAGGLNSANAFGHLAGALLAIVIVPRVGAKAAIIGAVVCTALAIAATPISENYGSLLVVRFLAGLTGAIGFVAGGALAARAASVLGDGAALGVGLYYAGPGVGIMLSAVLVPALISKPTDWPYAWHGMGAVSIVMAVAVIWAAMKVQGQAAEERPFGTGRVSLLPALIGYTLYAAGYVGYITFIVAGVREHGGSDIEAALWWAGLGFGGIVAGGLWAGVLRSRTGGGLALLTGLTGFAAAVPLFGWGDAGFAFSCVLFGATFLSVVAATTNLVRLARPPKDWSRWIAYFTVAFGTGQTLGPLVSGHVGDVTGSTDGVLWMSSGLLLAGAAMALLQRRVTE